MYSEKAEHQERDVGFVLPLKVCDFLEIIY